MFTSMLPLFFAVQKVWMGLVFGSPGDEPGVRLDLMSSLLLQLSIQQT